MHRSLSAVLLDRNGQTPVFENVLNACRARGLRVGMLSSDVAAHRRAIERLGVSPAEVVAIGDSPADCTAGRRAGVVTIGLADTPEKAHALRCAGARTTVRDAGELLDRLDELLDIASPRSIRLTQERIEQLMRVALEAAERGMGEGEVPIGCCIAAGDGRVLAANANRMNATQDKIMHAEVVAFHDLAGKIDIGAKDLILVSTLEPCVMCLGASMVAGVDTVLFGLSAPADGGCERVSPPLSPESQMPRLIGQVLAEQSRTLLQRWLDQNADTEQANFVKQLLSLT